METMTTAPADGWLAGDAYESYMGRWSRLLARECIAWLAPQPRASWLEIGCGTGALTTAICEGSEPASVVACDPSAPFIAHARRHLPDPRVSFVVAGAEDLPRREGGFDVAVSGLVVNFLSEPALAVTSVRGRLRPSGTFAAYVWDYAEGMEWLRMFWDEAVALDPDAAALDEGARFPLCEPSRLASLLRSCGFRDVETRALAIPTSFPSFDDYWGPFLRGTGPAPAYVASLTPERREMLRARLDRRLKPGADGRIALRARAWAVRGVAPGEGQP
jgi:SAM-dependent methyltransferase